MQFSLAHFEKFSKQFDVLKFLVIQWDNFSLNSHENMKEANSCSILKSAFILFKEA